MSAKRTKPAKPYADFPLFAHAAGVWAKKIKGKLHYFGPWGDPEGSLAKYRAEVDDLQAGRTPRPKVTGNTLVTVVNEFLTSKQVRLQSGELSPRTMKDYQNTCRLVLEHFGKDRSAVDLRPDDFRSLRSSFAQGVKRPRGLVAVGNLVRMTRVLFAYAYAADLIDKPLKFGPDFKLPSPDAIRKERRRRPERSFTKEEISAILAACGTQLKAMTMLAINAALGPTDLGTLPLSALDLKGGWLDFPRVKNGKPRRAKLWPETLMALQDAIAARPAPADPAHFDLAFITEPGNPWVRTIQRFDEKGAVHITVIDAIGQQFVKVLKRAKITRDNANFYGLRHTFRTIADETRDEPAIDLVMGHGHDPNDMGARYREFIDDERVIAVVDHVHAWLFGAAAKPKKKPVKRAVKSSAKQATKST